MATSEEPSKVPGLEHLMRLVTVNLHQKDSGFKGNKYAVLAEDELLFDMKEDGHALTFLSKTSDRGFRINSVDNTGQHVFSIRRPSAFMSAEKVKLYMNDTLVSIVRRKPTFITPVFNINDARDVPVLRVKGYSAKISFQLQTLDKTIIGSITKQNRGLLREMFSNNHYTITFPADLDVRFKLAVICTCVFIDYIYHGS